MGTFISAILSSFSKESSTSNNNQTASSNPSKLTKRKSKPELLVHRPNPSHSQDSQPTRIVHEFIWKYGGKEVLLAGAFTDWKPTIHMVPSDANREYWRALVELDPSQPWEFKFVVDGIWRCSLDLPTISDPSNNTNNIIHPDN